MNLAGDTEAENEKKEAERETDKGRRGEPQLHGYSIDT